jgi:hypothetical protein
MRESGVGEEKKGRKNQKGKRNVLTPNFFNKKCCFFSLFLSYSL